MAQVNYQAYLTSLVCSGTFWENSFHFYHYVALSIPYIFFYVFDFFNLVFEHLFHMSYTGLSDFPFRLDFLSYRLFRLIFFLSFPRISLSNLSCLLLLFLVPFSLYILSFSVSRPFLVSFHLYLLFLCHHSLCILFLLSITCLFLCIVSLLL